jgi:hypothetical protein
MMQSSHLQRLLELLGRLGRTVHSLTSPHTENVDTDAQAQPYSRDHRPHPGANSKGP